MSQSPLPKMPIAENSKMARRAAKRAVASSLFSCGFYPAT